MSVTWRHPPLEVLHDLARRRGRLRRGAVLLVLIISLAGAAPAVEPAPALAGSYDVYSCTQPNGAAAPIDGWSPFTNSALMVAEDTCSQADGYMIAGMIGYTEVPAGAEAGWTFAPPAGTKIKEASINWYYNNSDWQDTGYATAFESIEAPYRGSYPPIATCVHSAPCCCNGYHSRVSPESAVKVPESALEPAKGFPEASVTMIAGCETTLPGGYHCDGASLKYAAVALMSMATITLEDNSPPTVSIVGGSLTSGNELEGTQTLALTASDKGSGIYQAILEVDGKQVQATTIDNNGGRCENVGQTTDGRPAFLYVVPCALEINDQYVSFNLAGIPDGPHTLAVVVTDAAGNRTTAFSRQVIVGRGACNGSCNDQAKLAVNHPEQLKAITAQYARSAMKLSGTLREPSGTPVAGAVLELLQQPSYTSAPMRAIRTTTTNAAGDWTINVPKGPSRVLLVGWRSHTLDSGYASQLEYHERVFADITLRAPWRVRAGVPFAFRGALGGGYIPPERCTIQMEIYFLGRWRTIETLRTGSGGRFAYGYTFSPEAGGRRSYIFRAVIQYSHAYPFLAASSRAVRVAVRY